MNNKVRYLLLCLMILPLVLHSETKVQGEIVVAGQKVKLIDGMAMEDGEMLTVILSDQPFPATATANEAKRRSLWDSGKVQGVELHIYKDSTVQPDIEVYHKALKGSLWISDPEFTIRNRTADTVQGRLLSSTSTDFFGKNGSYSITFELPIVSRRD